jgi:flagellar biogenesis protein FliO
MRRIGRRAKLSRTKGDAVHWMDGSDWFWMSSMMLLWIALIGFVVYVAVRAARRLDPKG